MAGGRGVCIYCTCYAGISLNGYSGGGGGGVLN